LLSSEDESLLIWGDAFLVLDLLFNVVDGVRRFDFESDGLASESFNEDLNDEDLKNYWNKKDL